MSAAVDVPRIRYSGFMMRNRLLRTPRFWWTGSGRAVFEKRVWKAHSGLKRWRLARRCGRRFMRSLTEGTFLSRSIAPNWRSTTVGRPLRRR